MGFFKTQFFRVWLEKQSLRKLLLMKTGWKIGRFCTFEEKNSNSMKTSSGGMIALGLCVYIYIQDLRCDKLP